MNPSRESSLVGSLLRMAREAGFHQAKHWIDAALGYQPTMPADPAVERDRLAEELSKAAEHFLQLQHTAQRLIEQGQSKLRAA